MTIYDDALQILKDAGWTWTHDPDLREHLTRHAPGSLTVGSKFSDAAWSDIDSIQRDAETRAVIALAQKLSNGDPMRVEIEIPYPDAGTQGVISHQDCDSLPILTRTRIVRDPGTLYEQPIDVAVIDPTAAFPPAHQILAPAGALWDTRNLGFYTLFPGSAARPFPKDEQADSDPEFHAGNILFWSTHIFIATPNEVVEALQKSVDSFNTLGADRAQEMNACIIEMNRIQALKDAPHFKNPSRRR